MANGSQKYKEDGKIPVHAWVDRELHTSLKVTAAATGKTITQALSEAIMQYVSANNPFPK